MLIPYRNYNKSRKYPGESKRFEKNGLRSHRGLLQKDTAVTKRQFNSVSKIVDLGTHAYLRSSLKMGKLNRYYRLNN